MNIVLFGAQGSGKGTQAEKLVATFHCHHISSGDIFRDAFEDGSELGRVAHSYIERGELVPDDITVEMMLQRITQPHIARAGFILDGFPRTIAQAKALDEGLAKLGREIDCSVYFDVPRAELIKRLSGRYICKAHQHVYNVRTKPPKVAGICDMDGSELYQRTDDQGPAIEKRLDIFFSETIQLLDYYRAQNKLLHVDGNRDIDEVSADLIERLKKYLSR
ncbi:adenylate kinase [Ktedonobacteria bacterium brp13]|nr:adenylate kinase [Ktedonobacteria bacterium brp13]